MLPVRTATTGRAAKVLVGDAAAVLADDGEVVITENANVEYASERTRMMVVKDFIVYLLVADV